MSEADWSVLHSVKLVASGKLSFDKIRAILERLPDEMADKEVQVGWFEGNNYENGTPVAYVAAIQEFGAPSQGIPPRPFIEPTIEDNESAYVAKLGSAAKAVIAGKLSGEDAMQLIGDDVAGDIRVAISNVSSPPLSPITVMLRGMRANDADLKVSGKTVGEAARRVADGETNYGAPSKPLVDSGLMFSSVQAAVVKK